MTALGWISEKRHLYPGNQGTLDELNQFQSSYVVVMHIGRGKNSTSLNKIVTFTTKNCHICNHCKSVGCRNAVYPWDMIPPTYSSLHTYFPFKKIDSGIWHKIKVTSVSDLTFPVYQFLLPFIHTLQLTYTQFRSFWLVTIDLPGHLKSLFFPLKPDTKSLSY